MTNLGAYEHVWHHGDRAIAGNRPLDVHLGYADPVILNFPETQSLGQKLDAAHTHESVNRRDPDAPPSNAPSPTSRTGRSSPPDAAGA
ncbi:hypothetical protein [Isoptericola cucumis]|uniref:Uncharacterized protein n=1 Tax=Isoptericola cucumis TaxID=1776856 RepID=A0ABQ2B908_9MICO|nr:hypothetical protein [Isoptericola cucumis]GGI08077.1 hypothetical protein GCM10007368_19350 [Isoptericola cucumis]